MKEILTIKEILALLREFPRCDSYYCDVEGIKKWLEKLGK